MPTVQELVNSTLRLIRVLDSGEQPTATESNDALVALNQIISGWSAAGVPVYQESKDTFALTGAPSYPLLTRPVKLTAAQVTFTGISNPVRIVSSQQWSQPKERTLISKWAQELYYDAAFPFGNIWLWPSPALGSTLELFSLKPLTQFATLGETINLPPGYEQGLRYALAAVLAPEYGTALPPEYAAVAAEAKASISTMNTNLLGMSAAPAAV